MTLRDPAVEARLRLARLPDGAPVRLVGRKGTYAYMGMDDGLVRLLSPEGAELRAGVLTVEAVEP
jgi:hypothetical protein